MPKYDTWKWYSKTCKMSLFSPTWGPYQRPFSVSGAIQYGDPTMGNFVLLSLKVKLLLLIIYYLY